MQTDLLVGEEGGRLEGLEVGVVGRLKNYLYKKNRPRINRSSLS